MLCLALVDAMVFSVYQVLTIDAVTDHQQQTYLI